MLNTYNTYIQPYIQSVGLRNTSAKTPEAVHQSEPLHTVSGKSTEHT